MFVLRQQSIENRVEIRDVQLNPIADESTIRKLKISLNTFKLDLPVIGVLDIVKSRE